MKRLNSVKWLSLLAGILLIICSILYIVNPLKSTMSLVRIVGVILTIVGITRVIRYFSGTIFSTGSVLVGGIIDILLGIIVILNVEESTLAFSIIIAFWVLINGVTQIAISLDHKRIEMDYWWFDLISGILGIILGVLLLGDFNLSVIYITLMVGTYMLLLGVAFIMSFFGISKLQRKYRDIDLLK